MSGQPDRDELRTLVRAALRDALSAVPSNRPAGAPSAPAVTLGVTAPPQDGPVPLRDAAVAADGPGEVVAIRTQADLDAFVRRLLTLFDNPKHRADLRSGRRRFRLAARAEAGGSTSAAAVQRVEKGAVTEAQVKAAAAAGTRLLLGRSAVLTPLARDKARALGVVVDKER